MPDVAFVENLSNQSSGVQIPWDIGTRFGCYLYSTECSWIINIYSTLNKITRFWLDERSTINPKLYSVGVPIMCLSNAVFYLLFSCQILSFLSWVDYTLECKWFFFLPKKRVVYCETCSPVHDEAPRRARDEIFNYNDFVECTINKKSHDLFVQLMINGYSKCFESSQITLV